jgi:hypothetical protein
MFPLPMVVFFFRSPCNSSSRCLALALVVPFSQGSVLIIFNVCPFKPSGLKIWEIEKKIRALSKIYIYMPQQNATTTQEVKLPNSNETIKVEVELIPADQFHDTFAKQTNVTKVNVDGKEFFAVVGKTRT